MSATVLPYCSYSGCLNVRRCAGDHIADTPPETLTDALCSAAQLRDPTCTRCAQRNVSDELRLIYLLRKKLVLNCMTKLSFRLVKLRHRWSRLNGATVIGVVTCCLPGTAAEEVKAFSETAARFGLEAFAASMGSEDAGKLMKEADKHCNPSFFSMRIKGDWEQATPIYERAAKLYKVSGTT